MSRKLELGSWTPASRALGFSAAFQRLLGLPGEGATGPHTPALDLSTGDHWEEALALLLSKIGPLVELLCLTRPRSLYSEPSVAPSSLIVKAQALTLNHGTLHNLIPITSLTFSDL